MFRPGDHHNSQRLISGGGHLEAMNKPLFFTVQIITVSGKQDVEISIEQLKKTMERPMYISIIDLFLVPG